MTGPRTMRVDEFNWTNIRGNEWVGEKTVNKHTLEQLKNERHIFVVGEERTLRFYMSPPLPPHEEIVYKCTDAITGSLLKIVIAWYEF